MPPVVDEKQVEEMTGQEQTSALAETTTPDPEEHGTTGPETDDLGSPQGVVAGQETREAQAEQGQNIDDTPDGKQEEQEETEEFEEFEISLSEDSPLSEEQFNALMDIVEKKGFTKEEAESLIKLQEEAFSLGGNILSEQKKKESEENRKALILDPEFGGTEEGFKEALKVMQPVVKEFGDDAFNELLQSEIGNHPALGRFIFRLGKAMESDSFHGKSAQGQKQQPSALERMYPSFFEKA